MAKITKEVTKFLLEALRKNQDNESPIVIDGEKTYLRYDAIHIERDGENQVKISFVWLGKPIGTMSMWSPIGNAIVLSGIDGRSEFTLE